MSLILDNRHNLPVHDFKPEGSQSNLLFREPPFDSYGWTQRVKSLIYHDCLDSINAASMSDEPS